MGSCSGGTSSRVADSGTSTSTPSISPSPSPSGSQPSFVALNCPNGSVVNALTQICPLTQDQANQLGNDAANRILN